jgi:hypothetical protein
VLAAVVLAVAIGGGLAGALIGVSISGDGRANPSPSTSTSRSADAGQAAGQATTHDGGDGSGSGNGGSGPGADSPSSGGGGGQGSGPGKVLVPAKPIALADEDSLTYDSASGPQQLLTYYGLLGELSADNSVNLAVLDPPEPASPNAAYTACQNDGSYTSQITLNSLEQGSSICAFTPNHQVFWIEFRPGDPNAQSSALALTYTVWQAPSS